MYRSADDLPGDTPVEMVPDIQEAGLFMQTELSKKDFVAMFKAYMKKVVKHLKANKPDEVEAFKAVRCSRAVFR